MDYIKNSKYNSNFKLDITNNVFKTKKKIFYVKLS